MNEGTFSLVENVSRSHLFVLLDQYMLLHYKGYIYIFFVSPLSKVPLLWPHLVSCVPSLSQIFATPSSSLLEN